MTGVEMETGDTGTEERPPEHGRSTRGHREVPFPAVQRAAGHSTDHKLNGDPEASGDPRALMDL